MDSMAHNGVVDLTEAVSPPPASSPGHVGPGHVGPGHVGPGHASRRAILLGAAAATTLAASTTLAACGKATNNGSAAGPLAKTGDIPVGGGKVFVTPDIVVTQPSAGTFKAFSSICTHQGCTVAGVNAGKILCVCHGSEFSIVDGSVQRGPATMPLPKRAITVAGNEISTA